MIRRTIIMRLTANGVPANRKAWGKKSAREGGSKPSPPSATGATAASPAARVALMITKSPSNEPEHRMRH